MSIIISSIIPRVEEETMSKCCGIVGHIGNNKTKEILLSGLQELEYRGYDSAGIALLHQGNFYTYKSVGKLHNSTREENNQIYFLYFIQNICKM